MQQTKSKSKLWYVATLMIFEAKFFYSQLHNPTYCLPHFILWLFAKFNVCATQLSSVLGERYVVGVWRGRYYVAMQLALDVLCKKLL